MTAKATPNHKDAEQRIAYLISRFLQKKCSRAEADELDEWVGASEANELLFEALFDDYFLEALALNPALVEALGRYHRLRQQKQQAHPSKQPRS